MTTDLCDTALPRFEDRLWGELSEVHRQRKRPVVGTPHQPKRRRRPLAIGAAVAVAAATTLVIGLATLPGSKPPPAEATIEERIVAATDTALADSLVHVFDDFIPSSDGLDREIWYDHTTSTSRIRDLDDQGAAVWDGGPAVAPRPGDEAPDLTGRDSNAVVMTDCEPVPGDDGAQECDGWDSPEGYPTRTVRRVQACDATYVEVEEPFRPTTLAELHLRDEVAAGHWAVDGTGEIDGRELLRLRRDLDLGPGDSSEQTVYVDPDTYLPVELHDDVGGPDENVLRFEYLPRTAANLALLSPPVPQGYTEVTELAACD